jgi:hypothetical protein
VRLEKEEQQIYDQGQAEKLRLEQEARESEVEHLRQQEALKPPEM